MIKFDLSVIVPVYNVENYIEICIQSLLNQRFDQRLQIILIEDQSTDNSLELCRKYENQYSNVYLIEHKENGGSAVARNTGLTHAEGEYYVFVDPDDIVPNDAFSVLYNNIHNSGADIVKGSNTLFSKGSAEKLAPYSIKKEESYFKDDCLTILLKHEKLRGHPWGKIFRFSSFKKEQFTPGFFMAQDLLYCAEVFSNAEHILIIPDIVYKYRLHNSGATGRKYETGAYKSWIRCITEIQNYIKTKEQNSAYQELKIRTLTQLARETRALDSNNQRDVFITIEKTQTEWIDSFKSLLFREKVSLKSILRFFKYKQAMNTILQQIN